MVIDYATRATAYMLYDGTNGADVRDALAGVFSGTVTLVSDEDGTAVITWTDMGTTTWTLSSGDRISYGGEIVAPTEWSAQFVKV